MLLLDRSGAKSDLFARIELLAEAHGDHVLAPFALLADVLAQREGNQQIGVFIDNTQKVMALEPFFEQLALIVVAFPSGTDGRGFSIARQLRERGYRGALRASGPLFSDEFPQALACGFDEVEVTDASAARQPAAQWVAALSRISLAYQRDFNNGATLNILDERRAARNILDQRRAARLAGESKNV